MSTIDPERAEELIDFVRASFDERYYEETNPDVASAGIDPLGHFILNGMIEGRAPNPRSGSEPIRLKLVRALGRVPTQEDLQVLYDFQRRKSDWRRRIKHRVARFRQTVFPAAGQTVFRIPATQAELETALQKYCNLHAFNALNAANKIFENSELAIRYLLSDGFKTLDPLDFHLIPDLRFYSRLYQENAAQTDGEVYRDWLSVGLFKGKYISEAHLLRQQGAKATRISHIFNHLDYASHFPDIPAEWTPEQILEHFLTTGIREGRLGLQFGPEMVQILEDCIETLHSIEPSKAVRAAERLMMNGVKSERLLILVAKHLVDLDRVAAAHGMLKGEISDVPIEEFWLKYLRAEVFKRVEMPERAIEELNDAIAIEDDSIWVEGEHQKALETTFHRTQARVTKLASLDQVERGRDELDAAIDFTYDKLKLYGSRDTEEVAKFNLRPASRQMRIGILADCYLPQCKLYRVDQKLEQIEQADLFAKVYDFREDAKQALHDVGQYDAWLFYRTPAHFDVLKVVKAANALCRPTIYEIDDLLFDPEHYPEPIYTYGENFPIREYNGLQISPVYTAGVARHCDYGLASTPELAKQLSKLVRSGNAEVHRNALSSIHSKAIERIRPSEDSETIKIFYGSGTRAHKKFFQETFLDAVADVMAQRENVELHVFGYTNSDDLRQTFPDRVFEREPVWDVLKYWQALSEADINVAILKKSLLTDCKSEIKWLEAAMLGVPSIVSATSTMAGAIREGETGLLARNKAEWVEALMKLIDDAGLRERMGSHAQQEVLEKYSLNAGAQSIRSALETFEAHFYGPGGDK